MPKIALLRQADSNAFIFSRYLRKVSADTSKFQAAILPLLNDNWQENKEILIKSIQVFAKIYSPEVHRDCIEATKAYINGQDFRSPGRFETKWSFWGGEIKYVVATSGLTTLNQALNSLVTSISGQTRTWAETLSDALSCFWSSAAYRAENPKGVLALLLCSEAVIASAALRRNPENHNALPRSIVKHGLERIPLFAEEDVRLDLSIVASKAEALSRRSLAENNSLLPRSRFENFIEAFTNNVVQFNGKTFESTKQYLSYFLDAYKASHSLAHYALQQAGEDILLVKLHSENSGYTLVLKTDFQKQRVSMESIKGPYATGNDWLKRYGFEFGEIPDYEAERDIKKEFLQADNVEKSDTERSILVEVKGKVFGICIPALPNLDVQVIQRVKTLAQSGATIHLVYPIKAVVFSASEEAKVGHGKIVFDPAPKDFYIEQVRLVFDSILRLDGVLHIGLGTEAENIGKIYVNIRGGNYISLDFYDERQKLEKSLAQQTFPPMVKKSRTYYCFLNTFSNLNASSLWEQTKPYSPGKNLSGKNIILYSTQFWGMGGLETYSMVYPAYLMARNQVNIYLFFPDMDLVGEYLPSLKFGQGILHFIPIDAEVFRNDSSSVIEKSKSTVNDLINTIKVDAVVSHQGYISFVRNFISYMGSNKVPTFVMYHGGEQWLNGKVGESTFYNMIQQSFVPGPQDITGVVSRAAERTMRFQYNEKGLMNKVIYCGPLTNFNLFDINKIDTLKLAFLKERYNITSDMPVLITPHRIDPDKGIKESIISIHKAFKKLGKDFRVFVMGLSIKAVDYKILEYKNEIWHYIQDNGLKNKVIMFNGLEQEELTYYYAMANLGLLITKAEGKGLVTIEGRAMQVPWVLSNVDGIVDDPIKIFERGNITGSIFSIEILDDKKAYLSEQKIISNVEQTLLDIFSRPNWKDILTKAGKNGKKFVERGYALGQVIARHEYVLDLLTNKRALPENLEEDFIRKQQVEEIAKKLEELNLVFKGTFSGDENKLVQTANILLQAYNKVNIIAAITKLSTFVKDRGEEEKYEELVEVANRTADIKKYQIFEENSDAYCKKRKLDSYYFQFYNFAVDIDIRNKKIIIISIGRNVEFNPSAREEIIRRVIFLKQLFVRLKNEYLEKYDAKRLSWPEYTVHYVPYTSQDSVETSIYGFTDIPRSVEFIAGTNIFEKHIEREMRKIIVNPQPIIIKGSELYGSYDQFELGNDVYAEDPRVIERSKIGGSLEYWQNDILGSRIVKFLKPIILQISQKKNLCYKELRILDIGCNRGHYLKALEDILQIKKLYGIDSDTAAIKILNFARERAQKELGRKDYNIFGSNTDIYDPDVKTKLKVMAGDYKFDLITLMAVLEHLPDPERALAMMSSILNNGGAIAITHLPVLGSLTHLFANGSYSEFQKFTHYNFFTINELEKLASKNGFRVHYITAPNAISEDWGWPFLTEETLPYIFGGKWYFFQRKLPGNIKFSDIFVKGRIPHFNVLRLNSYGKNARGFGDYKYYSTHKKHLHSLFKKFFLEALEPKFNKCLLPKLIDNLNQDLFNTLILNNPTGILEAEKEKYDAGIDSIEQIRNTIILFESAYNLKIRQIWGYLIKDERIGINNMNVEANDGSLMEKTTFSLDFVENFMPNKQKQVNWGGVAVGAVAILTAAGTGFFCYRKKICYQATLASNQLFEKEEQSFVKRKIT